MTKSLHSSSSQAYSSSFSSEDGLRIGRLRIGLLKLGLLSIPSKQPSAPLLTAELLLCEARQEGLNKEDRELRLVFLSHAQTQAPFLALLAGGEVQNGRIPQTPPSGGSLTGSIGGAMDLSPGGLLSTMTGLSSSRGSLMSPTPEVGPPALPHPDPRSTLIVPLPSHYTH